jgi:hypothetical protein
MWLVFFSHSGKKKIDFVRLHFFGQNSFSPAQTG